MQIATGSVKEYIFGWGTQLWFDDGVNGFVGVHINIKGVSLLDDPGYYYHLDMNKILNAWPVWNGLRDLDV
jgi:hypothetical protein